MLRARLIRRLLNVRSGGIVNKKGAVLLQHCAAPLTDGG